MVKANSLYVLALYDYSPENGEHGINEGIEKPIENQILHFSRGETLLVLGEVKWWLNCCSIDGEKRGYVPSTLFAPLKEVSGDKKSSNGERIHATNGRQQYGERKLIAVEKNEMDFQYFPNAPQSKKKEKSPEMSANIFSKITFWWLTSLMVKGFRRPLTDDDLWELQPSNKVGNLIEKLSKEWKKEVEKHFRSPIIQFKKKLNDRSKDSSEAEVLFKPETEKYSYEESHKYQPSITKATGRAFGITFFFGAIFKFFHDALVFVSPYLLGKLIEFIKDHPNNVDWGYVYAVLLFVTVTFQTIFLHQYFYLINLVGMRSRSAIIAMVFEKMLRLSSNGKQKFTAGEMVNLMSVDSQKFFDILTYLNLVWSGPLQIIVGLVYLYFVMGWSIFAGFLIMILLIPLNTIVASKEKKFTIEKMRHKDNRSKLMNEILNSIKIIKLYAWEESFIGRVNKCRKDEMKELRKAKILKANYQFSLTIAPFLVSMATFGVYVLSGNELTAEKAFVSISLFNIIRFPLFMLPQVISNIVQFKVSAKRIANFLQADELEFKSIGDVNKECSGIYIKEGNFFWSNKDELTLKNINVEFKKESLSAIVGQVGAGKSSLLSALLGEIKKLTGEVGVFGKVAYVAQQPWIQNTTVRENILFGKPYEKIKYDHIIEACSLKSDLHLLPGGDLTEIGEKGINLSGGQKQRVALARAVYNNADIYIFDDPLSAVDVHVGKHIFDHVFSHEGLLQTKTRIMVTHNLTFLPCVDRIIVLKNGEISEVGSYQELISSESSDFADFLRIHLKDYMDLIVDEQIDTENNMEILSLNSLDEDISALSTNEILQKASFIEVQSRLKSPSEISTATIHLDQLESNRTENEDDGDDVIARLLEEHDNIEKLKTNVLIIDEKAETGKVHRSVFMVYARSLGLIFTIAVVFFAFCVEGLLIGTRMWLAKWSSDTNITDGQRDYYLGVYGAIGGVQAICLWTENILLAYCTVKSSIYIHRTLLKSILHSPMSFFETTPMGRIVNRFSKDIHTVDEQIPQNFKSFLSTFTTMIGTVFVISYSTPIFLAVLIPISVIYFFTQRFYVATSRQLKRIESVKRSPIYNHFFESIYGASTIRAFGYKDKFIEENVRKVDVDQAAWFPSLCANRWLAIRIELTGNLITFFAALFCVINRDNISPGIAGLSISYALQVTQTLNWLVRMSSEIETNVISVERLKEYIDNPAEAAWEIKDNKSSDKWLSGGEIDFQDFSLRYRDGLDLALMGINCHINAKEKVGIVGRTGAGKSTLISALFRIIEASGGKITIDGVDIATLGLKDLRSKLTVIPQDPILFCGSLRLNLDPFAIYSDEELWHALEVSHLKEFVESLTAGLQYEIVEGGENLSAGQRQLICLGRALLRKPKILILDEATAAVDMETDSYIQQTIREEFKDSTILTIAHRLNTIIDYDKIMVLSEGELKEFDSPENLLADTTSLFYAMVKDAGLVTS